MSIVLFCLDDNPELARAVCQGLNAEMGDVLVRAFPDGESYVRVLSPCEDRIAVMVCSLHQPDSKIMPLLLLANTLRDAGAKQVILLTPYLAYMRQDHIFNPGEALSARYFGELLSAHLDGLVTVDPHLHRFAELSEVYSIPRATLHPAPLLAKWLAQQGEPLR